MFAAWLLACLMVGSAGTWLARAYALRRNLFDAPGARRAHVVPTPRGGGVAIVAALLGGGIWLIGSAVDPVAFGTALAGLALVAAVGLIDDHRPLSPVLRLCIHAIASALLAFGAWHATGEPTLAIAAFVLGMALTNIWNFMDGIDGIAATQAALVALPLGLLLPGAGSWWAFGLVAATLGFLPFNFPKARIFLGDVGSGALGFALAALLVAALAGSPPMRWIAWALPISAFVIDATLTLAGRILRGERFWEPHALHAYQRWARRIGSHVPVTLAYAAWTLSAIGVMTWLGGTGGDPAWVGAVTAAWYTAGAGIWWMLQRKGSATVKETTA